MEDILLLLSQPSVWFPLLQSEMSPLNPNLEGLGLGQPGVQKSSWGLVQSLLKDWKTQLGQDNIMGMVSMVILRSAWVESDAGARGVM